MTRDSSGPGEATWLAISENIAKGVLFLVVILQAPLLWLGETGADIVSVSGV